MEKTYNKYTIKDWKTALKVFKSTGEIQDALLVFFDQHGKWFNQLYSSFDHSSGNLPKQVVPRNRLVKTTEDGRKILLSSFRSNSKKPIEMDYHYVMGVIEALDTTEFRAPNLISVDGGMSIEAEVIYVPSLEKVNGMLVAGTVTNFDVPNLRRIDGTLNLGEAQVINAPKLETVVDDLEAPSAINLYAPCLKRVGAMNLMDARILCLQSLKKADRIDAECAIVFFAPELEIVADGLTVVNALDFHAPRLQKVGLLFASSAINFHAPNLKTVEESLDVRSAEIFDALKLEKVGGYFTVRLETLNAAVKAGSKAAMAKVAEEI